MWKFLNSYLKYKVFIEVTAIQALRKKREKRTFLKLHKDLTKSRKKWNRRNFVFFNMYFVFFL